MPGRLDCSARLPNGTDLVRCPDDPAGHHCTRPAGHRPDHVCSCGVVFMLATDHATEVLVTSCWVVEEAEEPLVGAEYHWVLTPRDRPPGGLLGLSCPARDDFWYVVARLKALFGFDHWCMASRSWEDGAVHVVVAEKSPATTVRFEFGYPPADGR
jgi:hypothetical protein